MLASLLPLCLCLTNVILELWKPSLAKTQEWLGQIISILKIRKKIGEFYSSLITESFMKQSTSRQLLNKQYMIYCVVTVGQVFCYLQFNAFLTDRCWQIIKSTLPQCAPCDLENREFTEYHCKKNFHIKSTGCSILYVVC